jgi:hypothetical protein
MSFDLNNPPFFDDNEDGPAVGASGGGLPDLNFPARSEEGGVTFSTFVLFFSANEQNLSCYLLSFW